MLEIKEKDSIVYLGSAVPDEGGGSAGSEPVGATFGITASTGTRTGAAADYQFQAATTTNPGVNDFRKNRPEYQTQGVLWEKDSDGKFTVKVAEEGSSLYDRLHYDRSYTGLRTVAFNKFYYRIQRETDGAASYQTHYAYKPGFAVHPAFLMGNKTSSRIYVTKYKLCRDGSAGVTSVPGAVLRGATTQANFQTYCRNVGMIVMPHHVWAMIQLLGIIQCNNYNIQSAIGQGQVSSYKEIKATVAQENANSVIVSNANAAYLEPHRTFYVGGTHYKVTGKEAYDDDNTRVFIDGTVTTNTTSTHYAGFNWTGYSDDILSPDGENAAMDVSGRRTSVLLGLEDVWGAANCGLAGMCRINGNESLVSPDPCEKYEWPTATDNKGWDAGPAMLTANGYPGRFLANSETPQPWLFTSANNNGTSSIPTGDQCYANTDTDPKMCYAGGGLLGGGPAGLFCAGWLYAVSSSHWYSGARGVLDPRLVG